MIACVDQGAPVCGRMFAQVFEASLWMKMKIARLYPYSFSAPELSAHTLQLLPSVTTYMMSLKCQNNQASSPEISQHPGFLWGDNQAYMNACVQALPVSRYTDFLTLRTKNIQGTTVP